MKKVVTVVFFATILSGQSIQIFSPEAGETVSATDVLIAASLFGLQNVNPGDVRLFIDGQDMTRSAYIDADMLSYAPSLMSPGTHKIQIEAKLVDGGEPFTETWAFEVSGKERVENPIKFTGKVTSGFRYDNIAGEKLSVGNVGASLRGTAFDWIRFKANAKLTTEEDPLLQARNRFGLSLSFSKYLDLNIGDTNPRLSKFLIDGKRVRGFEAIFRLGIINIHILQGEINRAVQGSKEADEAYILSKLILQEDSKFINLNRKKYTFRQEVSGGRLGFGQGEIFKLGFSLLKIRDDKNSVKKEIGNAKVLLETDTLGLEQGEYTYSDLMALGAGYEVILAEQSDWVGDSPRDNIIVGTDLGFYLDHKRIVIESELAFSMLNRNIWDGALSISELDTLFPGDSLLDNKLAESMDLDLIPIDPKDIDNWFIVNQYMTPLAPLDVAVFDDSTDLTYTEAILSMPSLAMRARAKLNYFGNYFTIEFSQVGPEFNSLGNPFLLNNNREIIVSDRIRLLKNRLLLTLIYKHQDNDILTTISNVTSQNTITSNITLIPGPNLPTFNLSFRMVGRDNGITDMAIYTENNEDKFSDNREETQTTNVTATINYWFNAFGMRHNAVGTLVDLKKVDMFDNRDLDPAFVDPGLSSTVINITLNSQFSFPLKTTLSMTTNNSEFNIGPKIQPGSLATQIFTSGNLNAEYGLLNNRLTVLGGVNIMSGSGQTELTRVGIKAGTRIKLIQNLTANLITEFRNNSASSGDKSTVIANANLSYLF